MTSSKRCVVKQCVSLLLLTCITVAGLFAQATSGSMSGTIQDPGGAVVPGANVDATEQASGRAFKVASTEAGLYVFGALPPGVYTITVTQPGFKTNVQTGVEIRLGLRATLDIKLAVGDVQETVEVKAEVPLLETTSPIRGQNVSPQLMTNLPLFNGVLRNAESFVGYMPGVNTVAETSINGSNGRAKEVMIDGASLTSPESGGVAFNSPGFEAFGEFKLITSTFNAEYGRLGGGMEIFVTKSGSNRVHGSAFLNLKRDVLDAATWASNSNPANAPGYRPKERFNEEGGTAGGPVWIPKVYDGRNKSFFYFTYAKIIQPVAIAVNGGETLPTGLMRQGNFSEVATIYDPNSTTLVNGVNTRTPFANNQIPQNQWSKVSTAFLPFIPNTTAPGVTGNYSYIQSTTTNDYLWSLKIDHAITSNNRISFFLGQEQSISNTDQFLPGPLSNGLYSTQKPGNYRLNDDWILTPTLLLHTTAGYSRSQQGWDNPLQKGFSSKVGLNPSLAGTKADATPIVTFETDALQQWGMNQGKVATGGQYNWTTHINQQLTWTRGKHEFKMGWDLRRLRTFGNDWAGTNGTYYFSRSQTALPTALTTTGNAFASFLLGAVDLAQGNFPPPMLGQIRYGYHAGFWQDTWRITPRFTLDYGVRYEVPIGWHDRNGNYTTLNPTLPNPTAGNLPGALQFMGVGAGRSGVLRPYPTDYKDIGPRGGFAYRLTEHTVLRGGFGIYYQALGNGGCGCTDGFNGSFAQNSDGVNPAFGWDNGGVRPPAGTKPPPQLLPGYDNFNSGIYQMSPNYGMAPRIYNWSFTIQREYKNWLFEGAYVGNRGHGLNASVYTNQLPASSLSLGSLLTKNINDPAVKAAGYSEPFPGFAAGWGGGATLAQALRPYPQYGTVLMINSGVGKTWYDSFQGKIERRFGALNLMASYVMSKTLNLMTYRAIFSQGAQIQTQDSYNINDAKSYSPEDYPHYVNILTSYNLPVGKGKRFLSGSGRLVDALAGGWVLSATNQYRSGGLIQIVTPGNPLGSTIFSPLTKANYTGNPIRTGVASTSLDPNNPNVRWFNSGTSAPFAVAPAYTFGSTGMYNGAFRNPWFRQENFSIVKSFRFWESVMLTYRADAFNIFNRTSFGGVNGTVGNVNFGRVTGAQNGARAITMGLRAEF